jgi:hypothetical protein
MPLELALLLNVPPTGVMPAPAVLPTPVPEVVPEVVPELDVVPVSALLELPLPVELALPVELVLLVLAVPSLVLGLEPLELVVSPRPVDAGVEPVVAPESGE